MIFTDLIFLFGFLPLAMLIYWPFRNRSSANLVLLLLSLFFYGWGSLKNLILLLFILAWNFLAGLAIAQAEGPRRRYQLWLGIGINLFVLVVYKYLNPAMHFLQTFGLPVHTTSLIMPAGLSFYMFSCLSYLFDVYNRKAPVQHSPVRFGVYAAFFGRVNMGPIASYAHMQPQLEHHPLRRELFFQGGPLFFQGLFMKVLLADNLALLFAGLAGNTSWLGTLLYGFAYFFQLYMDFSGYSRMARGLACFFGFEIPRNFDKPYTALSVQDFWRRWHISLTRWFREYVYIPLGGNRVSSGRWVMNILAVWLLTGIWHGSSWNFVFWGLWQGILILAEKKIWGQTLSKAPVLLRHVYLVLTQLLGWTLFFTPDATEALAIILRYFGIGVSALYNEQALFYLGNYGLVLGISALISSTLPATIAAAGKAHMAGVWKYIRPVGYCMLFILCIAALVSATNQTFLYAAF